MIDRISLVVPLRNEARSIDRLLSSIAEQTRRPDEVILVDGASTDDTARRIDAWAKDPRLHLVHLRLDRPTLPGAARNRGVAAATSDWIAFTDAGIELDPGWLDALIEVAVGANAAVVYGDFAPRVESWFAQAAAIAYVPPRSMNEDRSRPPSVASMLLMRSSFNAVHGFPEELRSGEDLLFLASLEQSVERRARAPLARMTWDLAPDLFSTFRRFRRYSKSTLQAGLSDTWHKPVLSRYMWLIIGSATLGVIAGPILSFSTAVSGTVTLLVVRAAVACWRNRYTYPTGIAKWIARIPSVAIVLLCIDVGMIAGVLDWRAEESGRCP